MEPIEIYAKIQSLVKLEVDNAIQKFADQSKYNVPQIPSHNHDGISSSTISFEDLEGITITSVTPVDSPKNGTLRLYENGVTIRIYAFINNNWRYVDLT